MSRILTRTELAAHYRVSPRTIDRWMARRRISYLKIGGSARFDLEVIDRELRDRCGMSAQAAPKLWTGILRAGTPSAMEA